MKLSMFCNCNLMIAVVIYLVAKANFFHIIKSEVYMELDAITNKGILEDIVGYQLEDSDFIGKEEFEEKMNEIIHIGKFENGNGTENNNSTLTNADDEDNDVNDTRNSTNITIYSSNNTKVNSKLKQQAVKRKTDLESMIPNPYHSSNIDNRVFPLPKQEETEEEELENEESNNSRNKTKRNQTKEIKYVILEKTIPNINNQYSNFTVYSTATRKVYYHIEKEENSSQVQIFTFLELKEEKLSRKQNRIKLVYRYNVDKVFSPDFIENSIKSGEHTKIFSSFEFSNLDTKDSIQSNFNIFVKNLRYKLQLEDFNFPLNGYYDIGYFTKYEMKLLVEEKKKKHNENSKEANNNVHLRGNQTDDHGRVYKLEYNTIIPEYTIKFLYFDVKTPNIHQLKENNSLKSNLIYKNILVEGRSSKHDISLRLKNNWSSKGGSSLSRPRPSYGSKGGSSLTRPRPSYGSKGGSSITRPYSSSGYSGYSSYGSKGIHTYSTGGYSSTVIKNHYPYGYYSGGYYDSPGYYGGHYVSYRSNVGFVFEVLFGLLLIVCLVLFLTTL